jgi:endonuclease YncB( thermonuclease family)
MRNYFAYKIILTLCLFSVFPCISNAQTNKNKPSKKQATELPLQIKKGAKLSVKVVGITDGDTFKGLTDEKQEIRFRIYGIDAPEKKQAFGNRSKQYLSDMIFGKTVVIKVQSRRDRYGRPIVWIYTPVGKDVSGEMLKAGMAWHFKRYDSSKEYAQYEDKARKTRIGLWADNNPVAPWDFRKSKKKNSHGQRIIKKTKQ